MPSTQKPGTLYIVATPIGNLGDITTRAIQTLNTVDLIAAEDTRHSQKLLNHFGIEKPLISLHAHNEHEQTQNLLNKLNEGLSLALISDAGTPLISDPGYLLVHLAHQNAIAVMPIPGPNACITALSASGLPTDRFIFEGFLPAKSHGRAEHLKALIKEPRTLVFYEAPHRLLETLKEMVNQFSPDRPAVIARELTKTYETIISGSLHQLTQQVEQEIIPARGEIVIIVQGYTEFKKRDDNISQEAERIFQILLEELSVKQASALASKITGINKHLLYNFALKRE